MKIKTIQFIKGITEADYAWDESLPQIALYGRSNAGKSSTINAILNNKTIAKTSGQAGKTKQINLFKINNAFHLLDLPGYGYAKGSKSKRQELDDLINWYIADVQSERRIHLIVVDAQVGLTEADAELLEFLYRTNQPIILLLNKTDKMNQSEISKAIAHTQGFVAGMVSVVVFSATKKKGVNEVWNLISPHLK